MNSYPRYVIGKFERIGAMMPDGRFLELRLKTYEWGVGIEGGLKIWPSIESTGADWVQSRHVLLTQYDLECRQ